MPDERQSNRDRLRQITESIETGIQELFTSERYRLYLSVMSRFHRYSVNNTMLIYLQKPDATLVAGYGKWQKQFERRVKRGESGIKIIAPTPYKKKVEEIKRDPDTKVPILDANGKAVLEEKEVEIPLFRPVTVFDVSQTEGKPLPRLASDLHGDVRNYELFIEALKRSASVPISIQPISGGADGYFNLDTQNIVLREGMSEVQTISAAVHEIAHSILHNNQGKVSEHTSESQEKPKDRRTEEVEAESVSYVVCQYYGIQTGENSFGYIAGWSKDRDLKELKTSLETINKTAGKLINDIDRNFAAICKERGIKEKAEPSSEPPPLDQYPMPDNTVAPDALNGIGELAAGLLPLSREGAVKRFEQDMGVYAVGEDGLVELMLEQFEIANQPEGTLFAVEKGEWEAHPDFAAQVQNRLNHQQEREAAFLAQKQDCFAIYHLKQRKDTAQLQFMGMDYLRKHGLNIERENYDLIYTAPLTQSKNPEDQIYEQFNLSHPADYLAHSLSVSDIVVLRKNGVVTCHYVDSIGFEQLSQFLRPENALKNAEMSVEDDYNQIDGIINNGQKSTVAELKQQVRSGQTVSLTELAEAVRRESQPKRSVVRQLKQRYQEHGFGQRKQKKPKEQEL